MLNEFVPSEISHSENHIEGLGSSVGGNEQ